MVDPPRPKKKTKTSEADKSIMIPENPSGPPLDDVSSLLHPLFDESDALFFDLFSFLPLLADHNRDAGHRVPFYRVSQ